MFQVGQKVKCISSRWGATVIGSEFQVRCCPNIPEYGKIYTVRWVSLMTARVGLGPELFVRLIEITNPMVAPCRFEPVFRARQFVPLGRPRKTNIDWAYELLKQYGPVQKA